MVPVPLPSLEPTRDEAIEGWPRLDEAVLRSSHSRQVCMTCHFFRHHPGPNCIPLLTCHLHQGPYCPRRASHPPLQRLDRGSAPPSGLGA